MQLSPEIQEIREKIDTLEQREKTMYGEGVSAKCRAIIRKHPG
jgi:hypothetical protein